MSIPNQPYTRIEQYLSAIAGSGTKPERPYTRIEQYLSAIAGSGTKPERPYTRIEQYLDVIADGGGSGGGGGGGGKSSPLELLMDLTLEEPVHAIKVDTDQWSDYDVVLCVGEINITGGDWIYNALNATTGGTYGTSRSRHYGYLWGFVRGVSNKYAYIRAQFDSENGACLANIPEYVYMYCYASNKNFATGSWIKVFGVKYENL